MTTGRDGLSDLDCLDRESVLHYHEERPYQSKESELLIHSLDAANEAEPDEQKQWFQCNERFGGLLKHDDRKAA